MIFIKIFYIEKSGLVPLFSMYSCGRFCAAVFLILLMG